MSEFDQLFKEKVDEKKFEYSAKSWQSFKQKAGWKKSAYGLRTAIISAASVVVVAVGCFFGYRFLASANEKQVIPEKENSCQKEAVSEIVEEEATAMENSEQLPETCTEVPAAAPIVKKEPAKQRTASVEEATVVVKPDTTATKPTPKRRPAKPERVRHIFVINPDTIPNNDF